MKVRRASVLSLAAVVLAALSGDIAMLGVVGVAKYLMPGLALQWVLSVMIIGVGSYYLFGLTQIKAWEAEKGKPALENDFRARWGMRLLDRQTWPAFVVASLIGGPLVVGYASGYTRHPSARSRTLMAAFILASFWAALYLGILSLIFR